jgi:membrane protein DedA with SNARE-associated domain
MNFFTPDHFLQWLLVYRYLILFPLVALEGPIITIIAGSLVATSFMSAPVAFLVIVAGDLFGDSFYYFLGKWGGRKAIERWGRFIGINPVLAENLENHFDNHAGKTLFLGKISHGIGGIFLVAAGMANMPYSRFIWFNFLATLIKSAALLLVGYYFGQALVHINSIIQLVAFILIVVFIFAAVTYYLSRKKTQGKS